MRYPLMLSMISMTCIQAASPLKPEAPLIAQAEALYRSKTPLAPTGVDDILKLHLQGDAKFAFEAITGRWVVDSLASGKIPDECTLQWCRKKNASNLKLFGLTTRAPGREPSCGATIHADC